MSKSRAVDLISDISNNRARLDLLWHYVWCVGRNWNVKWRQHKIYNGRPSLLIQLRRSSSLALVGITYRRLNVIFGQDLSFSWSDLSNCWIDSTKSPLRIVSEANLSACNRLSKGKACLGRQLLFWVRGDSQLSGRSKPFIVFHPIVKYEVHGWCQVNPWTVTAVITDEHSCKARFGHVKLFMDLIEI